MSNYNITWTKQAMYALQSIYNYYKAYSLQGAENIKNELLESPRTIRFAEQYQIDKYNPAYRRINIRHYKVLYKEIEGEIFIIDILSSKQSPTPLVR